MPQTASATSDAYEAAKPLAPRNPTILIEQAIIKAVAGNREEALMLVEGVLNINPNITDAQQLRDAINATKVVDVEATATSTVSGVDEGGDSEAIDSVPETTEN
jgi:hypothetical protein